MTGDARSLQTTAAAPRLAGKVMFATVRSGRTFVRIGRVKRGGAGCDAESHWGAPL